MTEANNTPAGGARFGGASLFVTLACYALAFLATSTADFIKKQPALSYIDFGLSAAAVVMVIAIAVLGLADARRAGRADGRALLLAALRLGLAGCAVYTFFTNPRSAEHWLLPVLAAGSVGVEERKLFRRGFYIGAAIVAACFVLSMLDVIENNRGTGFGFIYRTHYACHLLCLALAWCLARDGRLSPRGELGLAALWILNLCFIGGKTLTGCLLAVMLATYWRHYRRIGGVPWQDRAAFGPVAPVLFRILYLPVRLLDAALRPFKGRGGRRALCGLMVCSFALCAALILGLSAGYRPLKPLIDRVPGLGSVKARLALGCQGFEEFPVQMMGTFIPQQGNSNTEGAVHFYYALDSGYVKLLLEYGWLLFAVVLGMMTWAQVRLMRAKRWYAMFLLTVFAIDGLMEYWMVSIGYNLFILLAFCRLQDPPPWPEASREPARRRCPGRAALALACAALACWWCATAYPISTWQGWTPIGSATVVVPGGYMDGLNTPELDALRLEKARRYLETYEDARCILSGARAEAMRAWMIERGVAPERLYVEPDADTPDAMLENATALIDREGLPPRMTVCTFRMQQYRVASRAKKLNIPVNALPVDMPWQVYLPNYFMEQWKITL